jgi:protein involved in polysaccharide export with SLBB domain
MAVLCGLLAGAVPAAAQDRSYLVGERDGLEMIVHVLGEVQKPGEYRVGDRTTLLELVSKAGGPTSFARLGGVRVRRVATVASGAAPGNAGPVELLDVNLDQAFRSVDAQAFLLRPGDVVLVPKNNWQRWKDFSAVVRDLSVIASAYFLYLRATDD